MNQRKLVQHILGGEDFVLNLKLVKVGRICGTQNLAAQLKSNLLLAATILLISD